MTFTAACANSGPETAELYTNNSRFSVKGLGLLRVDAVPQDAGHEFFHFWWTENDTYKTIPHDFAKTRQCLFVCVGEDEVDFARSLEEARQ